ncbi:MAG: hypothetical protein B7Z06_01660, partial [Flavobacteriales bacterium 32-35-8]
MTTKSNVDLSVIIVNYNGISYLNDCFNSLKANIVDIEYEIIVIDNDSRDNSCDYLKEYFPEVNLIESKSNMGFGKANNLGVLNAKGNTILLLNNDTIIQDNLIPAYKKLYEKPEHGIVAINMLNGNRDYI